MAEKEFVPEFLTYNNFGIRPIEAAFQIDCKTFTEIVRKIASEKISGIEDVTIQTHKNGTVGLFVWFNGNSEHFSDSSTENSIIRTKLQRLSNEMKDFISKFGWNEADEDPVNGSTKVHINKTIISNDNPEVKGKWVAVHVAINPFLFIIFDAFGDAFRKEYNRNNPKTRLRREWVWSNNKKTNVVGIKVTKMINNPNLSRNDLHAKWGGKFN